MIDERITSGAVGRTTAPTLLVAPASPAHAASLATRLCSVCRQPFQPKAAGRLRLHDYRAIVNTFFFDFAPNIPFFVHIAAHMECKSCFTSFASPSKAGRLPNGWVSVDNEDYMFKVPRLLCVFSLAMVGIFVHMKLIPTDSGPVACYFSLQGSYVLGTMMPTDEDRLTEYKALDADRDPVAWVLQLCEKLVCCFHVVQNARFFYFPSGIQLLFLIVCARF